MRYYHDGTGLVRDEGHHTMKSEHIGFFTSYESDGRYVSLVGDAHPVFHGSVVGAIASSARAALAIEKVLPQKAKEPLNLSRPYVDQVVYDDAHALICIHAPLHAKNALPGHLFRLELLTDALGPQVLSLVDVHGDILRFYVDRAFGQRLKAGMAISLMGPSGVRMRIPSEQTSHLLVSDDDGVIDLIAIYVALKKAGNIVKWIHLGDHDNWVNILNRHDVQWEVIEKDKLSAYCQSINAQRLIVMAGVTYVKMIANIKPQLGECEVVASVKGNAQCMLKGICAQCLQWQVDPVTMERTKAVFACSWQNEPIELIDLEHLKQRQNQTRLWQKIKEFAPSHIE